MKIIPIFLWLPLDFLKSISRIELIKLVGLVVMFRNRLEYQRRFMMYLSIFPRTALRHCTTVCVTKDTSSTKLINDIFIRAVYDTLLTYLI